MTPADAAKGVGGVFSETRPARINELQHAAVEQSRLHIPILFAFDTNDNSGKFVVEPGAIEVFAGDRSSGGEEATFRVTAR